MKEYYIRKIELVYSKEHGTLIEVLASRFAKACSEEQMKKCERNGFIYCPTFVMRYTKLLHMNLVYKKKYWEPMEIEPEDYKVEKDVLRENLPSKVFYVSTTLVASGIWDKIRSHLKKRLSEQLHKQ